MSLIAFDSADNGGNTIGTSLTYACTIGNGNNRMLVVGVRTDDTEPTGVTYNGVAMTKAVGQQYSGSTYVYIYLLKNPASGTHNVVISQTNSAYITSCYSSYENVEQTNTPDNTAVHQSAYETSLTMTLTTVADNCWLVGYAMNDSGSFVAGTGTVIRANDSGVRAIFDSDSAKTPAGSDSLNLNIGGGGMADAGVMVSLAPYTAPATTTSTSTSTTTTTTSTSTTTTTTSTSSSTSTTTTTTSTSTSTTTTTTSTSTSTSTTSTTTSTSSSTSTTTTTTSTSTSSSTTTTTTSTSTSTSTTTTTTSTSSSTSTTSTTTSTSTSTTTTTTSTSSSTSTTSTTTSTSTTTTTTLPNTGGLAFGEENPTEGEVPVSWQTWSDGAGGIPTISGDSNWGKLNLDLNDQGRSRVYDFGSSLLTRITITENKYGTGQGTATLQYRVSADVFNQDDVAPDWITYTTPAVDTFRYIQVRVIKT